MRAWERVQVGQVVPAYIHRNPDFRLPPSLATPILMVGPGTGLAPFRSFILQRLADAGRPWPPAAGAAAAGGAAQELGEMVLFFGCRRPDQDFLYGEELQALAAAGHLTLHTAFSRLEVWDLLTWRRGRRAALDAPAWRISCVRGSIGPVAHNVCVATHAQAKKVYVQDRLKEQGAAVWRLLHERGAHFYVCGDASSMAGAVERQLLGIIAEGLSAGAAEAQAYLDGLSTAGRYQRDVWY